MQRFICCDMFGSICLLTLRGQFVHPNTGNMNPFLYGHMRMCMSSIRVSEDVKFTDCKRSHGL